MSWIIRARVKNDGVLLFFHYIDMCRDELLDSTSQIQHWEPELTTMVETIFEKNSLAYVTNMEEVEYIQDVTRGVNECSSFCSSTGEKLQPGFKVSVHRSIFSCN